MLSASFRGARPFAYSINALCPRTLPRRPDQARTRRNSPTWRTCATTPTTSRGSPQDRRRSEGGFHFFDKEGQADHRRGGESNASTPWRSRRRTPTCGFARAKTAISRPPAATKRAANSTATIRNGAKPPTPTNTAASWRSPRSPAQHPQTDRRRSRPSRSAARESARHRCQIAGDHAHPRGERRIRPR